MARASRLSWGIADSLGPAMAKLQAETANRLELSDEEECLECPCGFTCGTPTAMQKHRGRCSRGDARSLPSSPVHRSPPEEQAALSRSLTTSLGEDRKVRPSRLHHASTGLSSYATQLRRQGTDGTLCCPCGFTCGTPMALERHEQRCLLHQATGGELPNQPAEKPPSEASPQRRPKAMTDPGTPWAPSPSPSPTAVAYAAHAPRNAPQESVKGERKALRLLLVRHGESANRTTTNKCPDPGLSEKGHRQAMALGHRLEEFQKEASAGHLRILSSPMLRCLQTIQPALDSLPPLPAGSCICHGACYEHGCAGWSFQGTPADEIVERFPQFVVTGFNAENAWDYQGSNEKETSPECATRAKRVLELLHQHMQELWDVSDGVSPVLIFVGHQTLGDLLLHLLLENSSKDWQYGTPKYKLKNASITELLVTPKGQVTAKEISSDYHVVGLR